MKKKQKKQLTKKELMLKHEKRRRKLLIYFAILGTILTLSLTAYIVLMYYMLIAP